MSSQRHNWGGQKGLLPLGAAGIGAQNKSLQNISRLTTTKWVLKFAEQVKCCAVNMLVVTLQTAEKLCWGCRNYLISIFLKEIVAELVAGHSHSGIFHWNPRLLVSDPYDDFGEGGCRFHFIAPTCEALPLVIHSRFLLAEQKFQLCWCYLVSGVNCCRCVCALQPAQPHPGHFVRTKYNKPVMLEPIPYEFIAWTVWCDWCTGGLNVHCS